MRYLSLYLFGMSVLVFHTAFHIKRFLQVLGQTRKDTALVNPQGKEQFSIEQKFKVTLNAMFVVGIVLLALSILVVVKGKITLGELILVADPSEFKPSFTIWGSIFVSILVSIVFLVNGSLTISRKKIKELFGFGATLEEKKLALGTLDVAGSSGTSTPLLSCQEQKNE
eukprot:TRINITY_DN23608_c0_g1_i1.p1 TRINITY_DN23608_c0_g1~~TRINITY_DN23608_c0_g1_i1.p1  ORF type:complete len:169 (-),score=45.51 TRINITY_DN23608_c0_g1_i1:22-528(-)